MVVDLPLDAAPIDFVGVKLGPIPLGWQGMIPRQAAKMAAITYDMLAANLIKPQELFDRIDPDEPAKEIEGPMLRAVDDVARQLAIEYYPGLWESLPEDARKLLISRLQAEAPTKRYLGVCKWHGLYENLLRPAVKEDEPLAIAVGAMLGFLVGELQVIVIERVVLGHWIWPLSIFLK